MYASLGRWRLWVRSPVTTDNFPILSSVTVLIRGTIKNFRGHRGFNPESSSPESLVCTTAVHFHKMTREMVVYKSVWTQRHKKDQRSEISTTGLRSRISEGPGAFAESALSGCFFSPCLRFDFPIKVLRVWSNLKVLLKVVYIDVQTQIFLVLQV